MKNLKTRTILCAALALSMNVLAQGSDYLLVNKKDNSSQSFQLDKVRKITFTDNNLVVTSVAGAASPFSFDAVRTLTFQDNGAPSAIGQTPQPVQTGIFYHSQSQSIVIDNAPQNSTVSIYNLQGLLLKKAVIQSEREEIPVSNYPAGVYIVKTSEKATKLIINK